MTDTSTRDFDHLFDVKNVVGVDYDPETGTVTAIVTQKQPVDDLADEDLVENNVDEAVETDVISAGLPEDADGFRPLVIAGGEMDSPDPTLADVEVEAQSNPSEHRSRYRPIPAGVSEIHHSSTAATGGLYPVEVTDPDASRAEWAETVEAGETVRLSNCHVYANSGEASMGDEILQPSPYDNGRMADRVGRLAGYLPLAEGVRADVAARTVPDESNERHQSYGVNESWPTGVYHRPGDGSGPRDYSELIGKTLTKSGRTTGVSRATLQRRNTAIRVNYGKVGTVVLYDQLITGSLSQGGDSGSPVFDPDGQFVGLVFAGSESLTAISPATTIEADFGVTVLPEADEEPEPEPEPPEEEPTPPEEPEPPGDGDEGNGDSPDGSDGSGDGSDDGSGGSDEPSEPPEEDEPTPPEDPEEPEPPEETEEPEPPDEEEDDDEGGLPPEHPGKPPKKPPKERKKPPRAGPGRGPPWERATPPVRQPTFDLDPEEHISEYTFEGYVEALLAAEYGSDSVSRQHRLPSGRKPDLILFGEWFSIGMELENDAGSLLNGGGQAKYYAVALAEEFQEMPGGYVPMLVFPEGHIKENERQDLKRTGVILWEVPVPDDLDLKGV